MANELINSTPINFNPVILFLTDGDTNKNDVKKCKELLKNLSSNPHFLFFSIGFGTGYKKSILDELSLVANNR